MAIIHASGATTETLDEGIPNLDPAGFDTLTKRVLHVGDFNSLLSAFPLGGQLSGTRLYCIGPQGGSRARFGRIWADIAYKGFASDSSRKNVTSWSVTTRETEIPRQYSKPGGGEYTSYVDVPWVPSKLNPKTGSFWRVRLIDRVAGATMQGATVGSPTSPPPVPTMSGSAPSMGGTNIDWANLYDPTVNYPFGWVLRDFQVNSQFTAGEVTLYFWTARFDYLDRYAP